ncbi:MAG: thiamine phosphate synthase [Fibrobacterota bacterium]
MLAVISREDFFDGEAHCVHELFRRGLQRFHMRKPGADEKSHRDFLESLPAKYHSRIVLHNYHHLGDIFSVGLHARFFRLNATGSGPAVQSTSCHSFDEVEYCAEAFPFLQSVFLSPVFDSISKEGYTSAFSTHRLRRFLQKKCPFAIFALGGITAQRMDSVRLMGFDGAAVLGALWHGPDTNYIQRFETLKKAWEL